jgi:hypothetical protein
MLLNVDVRGARTRAKYRQGSSKATASSISRLHSGAEYLKTLGFVIPGGSASGARATAA